MFRTIMLASMDSGPYPATSPVGGLLRDLVHERTGVYFDTPRVSLMLEKLAPLAASRKQSLIEYYYELKYSADSPEEWRRVTDALSVQETYFWREMSQVQTLVKHLVPRWFSQERTPLRIWSAACASGEEPYTIAMALVEAGWGSHPIQIVGTDASESALAKARAGVFRERSFRSLPLALRQKYFTRGTEGGQINQSIASRVTFKRANLVVPGEISLLACSPVVFCRNVFIYFSPEAIRRTLATLAEFMPAGGTLFVGVSESLIKLTKDFDLQELGDAFAYIRKPEGRPR